jgi:hypothetical protein
MGTQLTANDRRASASARNNGATEATGIRRAHGMSRRTASKISGSGPSPAVTRWIRRSVVVAADA